MSMLLTSEEFVSEFPSRQLSSSDFYPLDVPGLENHTGNSYPTDWALTVTGSHKKGGDIIWGGDKWIH
jgi:hypothetical protein